MPTNPAIKLKLRTVLDAGTVTKHYSTRPYADAVFTEGRVIQGGWGAIVRERSDDQGNPRLSSAASTLNDDDEALRTALRENETRFIKQAQATFTVLSEAGRAASLADRILFRGRLTKSPTIQVARDGFARRRRVQFDWESALSPYLDHVLPREVFLRTDFPDIHREIENTPIPLIGGEHSDNGVEDVAGNPVEFGMIPAIHVGTRRTDGEESESNYLAPPTNVDFTVNGTPGVADYFYCVTALSAYGETTRSQTAFVETGATPLTATNSITITWDPVTDATGYIVYGRFNGVPVRRLAVLAAGVTSYTDDGTAPEMVPGPPAVNTAVISETENAFPWDFYVVCHGVVSIIDVFGSDVAQGQQPTRVNISATAGVEILVPGMPGWPHANPYIETASGLRLTGFYARGPRSQHHKDGVVTFAVNVCGYEDVGDGSGQSIQQAFPLLQHFLNQFVFGNNGQGYKTGNWLSLATFADGTPMLNPVRFTACQDLTKLFLDNAVGYLGAIYLREQITVRTLLQWFFQTFPDCGGSENHWGQWYPMLYNAQADVSNARVFREFIEIVQLEESAYDRDNIEPIRRYQYDWNPDMGAYRSQIEAVVAQSEWTEQLGEFPERGVYGCRWSRDAASVRDAQGRARMRLKTGRWRQSLLTRFQPGLEVEPGDVISITHRDGPWVARPFYVTSVQTLLNEGYVRLTGYDISPLLTEGAENIMGATSGAELPFVMT